MKIPLTLSNQILTFLFKDKSGLIKYLKEIRDSPVSFSDVKGMERQRKAGILVKKLEKLKH
jgi:hypothetical protein